MKLLWPWGLLVLPIVAAAAVWALRRPMQRISHVSSLTLWDKALEALPASAARSARRVSAAWVLLLIGALLAGLALARPTWQAGAPARRVALAVCPSAELGEEGEQVLRDTAAALLDRLDAGDRVILILPTVLGGAGEPLSPDQASARIAKLPRLPAAGADLTLPAAGDVQHTYRLAAATLPAASGPHVTTIALPARPGQVTLDAVAAEPVGTPTTGVQILAAVRNHAAERRRGEVAIIPTEGEGTGETPVSRVRLAYDVPPGKRRALVGTLPGRPAWVRADLDGRPAGWLIARSAAVVEVAMVGRDDPLIRRFLRVHPALRPTADTKSAHVVFAIGAAADAGKPALLIDPPRPPPGFRAGAELANIALRRAGLQADHPLLAHVDLSSVAVRRSAAWRPPEITSGATAVVRMGEDVLIAASDSPPRVYVAFDLAAENTNFAAGEAFVIFMANVARFLSPAAEAAAATRYETVAPIRAAAAADWRRVDGPDVAAGPLPAPGVYRDAAGTRHAVSLTGLRSAEPETDAVAAARAAPLPDPQPVGRSVPLWPALLTLAAACWLAGWALRLR